MYYLHLYHYIQESNIGQRFAAGGCNYELDLESGVGGLKGKNTIFGT